MERGMGYNLHLSYTSDGYWTQLLDRFKADKPGALLLLDSFNSGKEAARALDAARLLPDTLIVYRKFLQGDNQYAYLSPAQWVAEHMQFSGTRIYCSADNEPAFGPSLPWLLEVAKAARAANIRVSLGGWSVGGYEISAIPQMDALLRYTAQHPGQFVYDLHEYCRGLWTADFAPQARNPADWPDSVPDSVNLWLMGRFRHILKYCDSAGIKRPQIVIGEYGFDRVHAIPSTLYGNAGGLNENAGIWQSWGYENWEVYGAAQLQAAYHAIYSRYGVPVCFYQLCDHAENWRAFNAYYAPTFMDATRKGFAMTTPTSTTPKPPLFTPGRKVLRTDQSHINLRNANGADIGDVLDGTVLEVLTGAEKELLIGGRAWWCQPVQVGAATGYLAITGTYTLTPVVTEPDPEAVFIAAYESKAKVIRDTGNEMLLLVLAEKERRGLP